MPISPDIAPMRPVDHLPAVAASVRAAIDRVPDVAGIRGLLGSLMARPGRVLAPDGAARWPVTVLDVGRALGGDAAAAIDAAAAVEFAVAAIDILDDVIDDEWPGEIGQQRRAANAGLALGWLAQQCAGQLAGLVGAGRALLVSTLIGDGSLASCAGQDGDLVLETLADTSEELAYAVTDCKSGSLAAMACRVGAAVATDDPALVQIAGEFGRHVGIVAQVLNDIVGVDPTIAEGGTDLRRRKKTLPVAFALRCGRQENLESVQAWALRGGEPNARDDEQMARAIRDLGGLHFGWVVAETHRREALAALGDLERSAGRAEVRELCHLIPPVSFRE